MFPRGAIFFESYDQATGAESLEKKVPSDVMWVSIDGSLCIASCLTTEPALIEVYWYGHLSPMQYPGATHADSLNILAKQKGRIEKEEKSKVVGTRSIKPWTH